MISWLGMLGLLIIIAAVAFDWVWRGRAEADVKPLVSVHDGDHAPVSMPSHTVWCEAFEKAMGGMALCVDPSLRVRGFGNEALFLVPLESTADPRTLMGVHLLDMLPQEATVLLEMVAEVKRGGNGEQLVELRGRPMRLRAFPLQQGWLVLTFVLPEEIR